MLKLIIGAGMQGYSLKTYYFLKQGVVKEQYHLFLNSLVGFK